MEAPLRPFHSPQRHPPQSLASHFRCVNVKNMPQRLIPFKNHEYYHVYNRGVEKRTIFSDTRSYQRFLDVSLYYLHEKPPVRYSQLLKLAVPIRQQLLKNHLLKPQIINIVSFVLMPNHFHLLLTQETEKGITDYMRRISDSYTKYYNIRYKRIGPLFQGQFKAVRIDSNEQLLHVSRYIHLNPYTSRLISSFGKLRKYVWSSLPDLLNEETRFSDPTVILSQFSSRRKYLKFLEDRADYQQTLGDLKHALLEESEMRLHTSDVCK